MPAPAQPYVAGDEGGNARLLEYRMLFLRAVGLVAPNAVELLRVGVGPAHDAYCATPDLPSASVVVARSLTSQVPAAAALVSALDAWAAKHNLSEPWLLDAALRHLRVEREMGENLPLGSFAGGSVWYWKLAQTIRPADYRPQQQTRAEYLADVHRYMDAVEAEYEGAGWQPAAAPGEIVKQLVWLARHQVLGMTYDQVVNSAAAETAGRKVPDSSTVRRAIHRAAAAIGLTPRFAPNRPR